MPGFTDGFVSFQARVVVMGERHMRILTRTRLALIIVALVPAVANAWSWQDLWKTPHQQRQALEQKGEFQALIESDSPQWQGAGHFRSEDYAAAADAFAKTEEQSSLYNQATALTRAGDYDSAIELFDELLSLSPEHDKAAHNQDIARQLKELQQNEQNQDQGENQDSDQQQDQSEQQDQSQQQQDQQNQQSDSSEQQDESSQASEQNENDDSESEENQQQQSEDEQSEAEQKEQQAQQQQAEEEAQQEAAQSSAVESDQPLSEDQQAIEQWLRKIPDDPSGLLRRKLIRSHRSDYPDIRDSQSPW